ncbi:MAG: peptidylprolyl isomerase [Clostridia bacterium]|nr:peptidylprolyl isomerase [Clostridia bacterium]
MEYTETKEVTDKVKIVTNLGDIIVELDNNGNAPKTVENFKKLVASNFYDGIIFHRVISGFMIQGGDPTGTGMGGSKEKIVGEFLYNGVRNTISHKRGVISMARSQMPNSASSQFFICHADATFLDGQYAAFGKVLEGIETVDAIAALKTDRNDKPLKEAVIKTMSFVK